MSFDQSAFRVCCEWGRAAVRHLGPHVDAVVVVDVLSFTTCVDVAVSRGAAVLPYRWRDDSAAAFAREQGAVLASHERRFTDGFSLSPSSLLTLPVGERLVLPSPNGGALCADAAELRVPVYAACLRNARAVGEHLHGMGRVLVVPAGERWPNGTLRPALEDWLGAGAVIDALRGDRSPEAEASAQAFRAARPDLTRIVRECSSGVELIERGFGVDVELAAQLNVSRAVPVLRDGEFVAA
ncbi:2-phosphosulfolactate phosphatase [uncultured Deinococcus sp.]|uniref:2-phosphosulfolactate phosphatase n=1 Tax=uncultured Deinococcus sp. TaxID=158789 RepID=UPI0025EC4437|nr:2-phosphosulfolactate phosphatase [uncultured Deinococcus sp.]